MNLDPPHCELVTASSRVAISVAVHQELMIADKMTLGVELMVKKSFEPKIKYKLCACIVAY